MILLMKIGIHDECSLVDNLTYTVLTENVGTTKPAFPI